MCYQKYLLKILGNHNRWKCSNTCKINTNLKKMNVTLSILEYLKSGLNKLLFRSTYASQTMSFNFYPKLNGNLAIHLRNFRRKDRVI